MVQATQLKRGMCIKHENDLYRVVEAQHKTPGNLRGLVQAKIRNLKNGAISEHRFRSVDMVERALLHQAPRPGAGWVEVITGSMFSGKSEELIRRIRRAQIARQKVQIFKPRVDDRYAADHIVSHSEMKMPSQVVHSAREILDTL